MQKKITSIEQYLLTASEPFPISKNDSSHSHEDCTSFEGIPRKYPGDSTVLVLYPDPYNDDKLFYEFNYDSIVTMEELDIVITENGKSLQKVRIWVKNGSTAVKSHVFTV